MNKQKIILIVVLFVILIICFMFYKSQQLKRLYKSEALQALNQVNILNSSILTENDIKHLPVPVQKYLRYVGVIGKEKLRSFRSVFEGEFKTDPKKGWAKFNSEQYNFIDKPMRFYYMKLNMGGIPVLGLHSYKNEKATMLIKLMGLFTVVDAKGEKMNQGETVTVFNDMCVMAPSTLIDKRITWETIDPLTVKATFNNNGIKVSAELYFNDKGELIDFISYDRYLTTSGESYINAPWSTPLKNYKDINGLKLATYGEAIWKLPEGDYSYAKLNIKEIEYNNKSFK